MSTHTTSLAVIVATYNRADVLGETLGQFCRVDCDGIYVRFYVVDNNSTDHTASVIEEYADRLPLVHLFEARQGKTCAVNHAIASLGNEDIILFTDDDVTPDTGWFREVLGACERWPASNVFGGRIVVRWPDCTIPSWAHVPEILAFGFAQNDLGDREMIYPPEEFPYGANFWLRREVIESGRTFNEAIGPHPDNLIMGDEVVFLRALAKDGHELVYCPAACVHHRIDKQLLSPWHMLRRAWARGRGKVHMAGIPHKAVLAANRPKWYLLRAMSLGRAVLRLGKAMVTPDPDARFLRIIRAISLAGIQIESMRIVRNTPQQSGAE